MPVNIRGLQLSSLSSDEMFTEEDTFRGEHGLHRLWRNGHRMLELDEGMAARGYDPGVQELERSR